MNNEAVRYAVIYNPVSGNGDGEQMAHMIEGELARRGQSVQLIRTQAENGGIHAAQMALENGCTSIVGIGGDGTLGEIVSVIAGKGIELFFVPNGTGNDFFRMLSLPKEPYEAFLAQLDGEPAVIDCASVNGTPYLNVSGSGFDVDVLRKTEELKSVYPGDVAYRKAVLSVISSYRPFEATLTLEDGEEKQIQCTICEVANGMFFGGGMRIAPKARCDDGLLDVVIVKRVPGLLIPLLLPMFIAGLHTRIGLAEVHKVRKAKIVSPGMTVNSDGKLFPADSADYQIMPGALRIRKAKKCAEGN